MDKVDELICTYRNYIKLANCFSIKEQLPYIFGIAVNILFFFITFKNKDYLSMFIVFLALAIILLLFIRKEIMNYRNYEKNICKYLSDSIIHYNLKNNISDIVDYIDILLELKTSKEIVLSKFFSYIVIPSVVSAIVGFGLNNKFVLSVYIFIMFVITISFTTISINYNSSNASNYKYSLIRLKKDLMIVKLNFNEVKNG